jgi:hypothetical protein
MIAMTVASIILVGLTAGYSALSRSGQRLATAQAGLADRQVPRCRDPLDSRAAPAAEKPRLRCTLPELCEYDTVSQSCRTTTPPSA